MTTCKIKDLQFKAYTAEECEHTRNSYSLKECETCETITNKLYRIWLFDSNDRREIARILAFDFETVQKFLLEEFIKPEFRKDVEEWEYGLQWDANTPEECLKYVDKSCESCKHRLTNENLDDYCELKEIIDTCKKYKLDQNYNPCEFCDGCLTGFQIEEIENPDGKSWGETFEFKTIMGTNDFYDLTGDKPEKAQDWNPLLARAWKIDPQTGCDMLTGLTKLAINADKTVDLEKSEAVKKITEHYKRMTKGDKRK